MRKTLFAVFCCLFLGSSLYLLMSGLFRDTPQKRIAADVRTVRVLKEVTAGGFVHRENLHWQSAPAQEAADRDLLTGLPPAEARPPLIFSRALAAGSLLKSADILRPDDQGYVSTLLRRGLRAKSLTIENLSGYRGLVHPGDTVDILLSLSGRMPDGQNTQPTVQTLIQDATIIGPVVDGGSSSSPRSRMIGQAGTLVLALKPEEAVKASLAQDIGKLSIILRTPGKRTGDPPAPQKAAQAKLADLIGSPPVAKVPPVPQEAQQVRVIRGSNLSTVSLPARTGERGE